MGGDHAPQEIVSGSLAWARKHPADRVLLVGLPEAIAKAAGGPLPANVEVVPASQVVEMHESPAMALKTKKDSSILVAMDVLKQGRADALVTAGHSGAGMAAAVLRLGRLPGVDRPALAVQMVTESGPFVLLDIGANMDSTGYNLHQFARMGSIYAERVLGVANPRVALVSIGEEKGKGNAAIAQATELLDADGSVNFTGNVEGKDIVKHVCDVAVCDALVGNVVMKFFEGLAGFIFDLWRGEFKRGIRGKLGYLFMRPGVHRIRETFDYERMGASPLLGVKGMVLITHGRAKRRMMEFAVEAGACAARARIPDVIAEAFRDVSRRPKASDGAQP
jgi:glycerol-3-phosphate acyltransferase PlsX